MTAPLNLDSQASESARASLYERVGPEVLAGLVERFYRHVAAVPALAALFPGSQADGEAGEALWQNTMQRQYAFLTGFLGGPPLYAQTYGHPRLRARHLPHRITPQRAREWLGCMRWALDETPELEEQTRQELLHALARVAAHMVNSEDEETT